MKKSTAKIQAILNNNGIRNEVDSVGNVWTYYGPQVWVATVAQAKNIVKIGAYS